MKHVKVNYDLIQKLMRQDLSRAQIIARTGLCPQTASFAMRKIRDKKKPPVITFLDERGMTEGFQNEAH